MISFNKETLLRLYKIISNPIFGLFLGIVVSIIFYYLGKQEKKPSFYISKPELISTKNNDKIKILYDNIEYSNLSAINLVLWNEGDKVIDALDLIPSNLPNLFSNDSIKFLSCEIIKKSRLDLNFNTLIRDNKIYFNIKNNEALENSDGVVFKIIYTNYEETQPNFNFTSRIKETKTGFIWKDLTNYKIGKEKVPIIFLWVILLLLMFIRVFVLLIYKKTIVFKKSELIFILVYLLILCYKTYNYIYFTTNISWIR